MQPNEMKAVLEQLVQTVAYLCNQTADLVDDYSTRLVKGEPADVRLRADHLRTSGRLLQQALHKASEGTDQ